MAELKALATYNQKSFPAMQRAVQRTEKQKECSLLKDALCDSEICAMFETVLRFSKNDRWVEDWECYMSDTLNNYFKAKKEGK